MNTESPVLHVSALQKSFRDNDGGCLHVLTGISFTLSKEEVLGIVGPSGCGKTTLLEIIAGLQNADDGKIELENDYVGKGQAFNPVMVFQDYTRSLLPFKRVAGNIRFALSAQSLTKAEVGNRLEEVLSITNLQEFADYYPWQLSGGMQQRVALARALALRPSVLLLDEPFASVDQQTQYLLEDEVLQIVSRYGLTVIYVTHDLDSAVYCSSRCIALSRRPARLIDEIDIQLPYPRAQDQSRSDPKFVEYRTHLYKLMKHEIENYAVAKST